MRANANPSSIIFTDDSQANKPLRHEYLDHKVINPSAGVYVRGDVYRNTIEGAFGNLKTGMRGAYEHVSPRYLQSYFDEYAWQHNAKHSNQSLFEPPLRRAVVHEDDHTEGA